MISSLTGTLTFVGPSSVVLDVGGVGFELGVSSSTAFSLPQVGEVGVSLFTRLVVREDALVLYGFATREERALFDKLISVSGVGPKLALAILSTLSPKALAACVIEADAARIATVPGVGKKLASRLILELEGAFNANAELKSLLGAQSLQEANSPVANEQGEVVAALLSMGFTEQEVKLALQGYEEAGATTVEKMLTFALKRLGADR